MGLEHFYKHPVNRRTFLRGSAQTSLGLVAGGSILAACGGGTGSPGTVTTVKVASMPSKASDPKSYAAWNSFATAWAKKNPAYKIVGIEGGFDSSTFYTQFAAGTAPDVIHTFFTESQKMIEKRVATDITDLFQKSSYARIFTSDALALISKQNHLYGLPYATYRLSLMYNRTLFQQAGLDPAKPPQNWADFRDYAKRVADKTGASGFVLPAAGKQGGWNFTNWLYSAGGRVETTVNGKVKATFNDKNGLAVLQLLNDMRWTDKSMNAQQASFKATDCANAVATGKAAMCIGSINTPETYYTDKGSIDFLGMGPMPQKDGIAHGVLTGGNLWIFNSKSSATAVQGGLDFIAYKTYDLGVYEDDLKAKVADGKAVGFPDTAIFSGDYLKQLSDITEKYANVPTQNYTAYMQANPPIVPEPAIDTQVYYSLLDPVLQAVFTQQNANPQQLLDDAASTFQSRYLDVDAPA
ncbi:sugar ABC transporter substrate-binding protein [Ktedonobacter sp. SOSP1-52]|uniref:ABC transporter substrate-binding protein n=1 Tax=Ktedonobacter sp. SOSP1-52 TaxID=2778366 RepID=UPI0019164D2E|nr:extracellular solute-binding protein [Ktedonobacter sp. SOSP1-52]GHO72129.1 sugar ABC transporter substrate-binding protein [Ktedonobacter sp. SOSP1-52]